jgi:DNA-binding MarR family transcriptional regulator
MPAEAEECPGSISAAAIVESSTNVILVLVSTEPRWLDDRQQQAWRAFYGASSHLLDQLDRQLQRDAGMPHAYYEILVTLSEAPGRDLRMSELAELTRSSRSRLSHAVAKLDERGWVCRRDHPGDRRGQLAQLTDAGFEALRQAAPGHVECVRSGLFDRLTDDQVDQLNVIMSALAGGGTLDQRSSNGNDREPRGK